MGLNKKTGFILTIIMLLFITNLAFATAPTISSQTPANGANINTAQISISFEIVDTGSGIKIEGSTGQEHPKMNLTVDGNVINVQAEIDADRLIASLPDTNNPNSTVIYALPYEIANRSVSVQVEVWDVNDNASPVITWTFNVDTTAPIITGTPANITAEATSSAGAIVNYTNPTATDNSGTTPVVSCIPASGGTFPLGSTTVTCTATDAAGNSATTTFIVTIQDTTLPAISSFSSSTGTNWTNSTTPTLNINAADSGSGLSTMRFSCNNSSWNSEVSYAQTYSGFNILTSTGCSSDSGAKTIYLQVKDTAGNWSSTIGIATAINYDGSAPNSPGTPDCSTGDGQVTLSWGSVNDNPSNGSGIKEYRIYKGGSYYDYTSGSTYSKTITGLSNGTAYTFRIRSADNAGNESSDSAERICTPQASNNNNNNNQNQNDFDIPVVAWSSPASGSTVSGVVTLEVTASDNGTGISSIMFELPDKNYVGTMLPASGGKFNGVWQLEWFAWGLENGKEYIIKVRANDSGHPNNSSAWISRTFKVDNSAALADQQKTEASAEIADAEAKKTIFEGIAENMQADGVALSEQSVSEKAAADGLLLSAKDQFAKKKYAEARDNAVLAAEKYSELADSLAVNDYGKSQVYSFAMEKAEAILKGLGFTDSSAKEASELISAFNATRKFSIKEIIDGDSTRYQAIVTVTLENSGEDREIKIIEIVPKEFAESADLIGSGSGMIVLEADPKIEFDLAVKAGETAQVSYFLKKELTKEEADQLLESNPMDLFVAPPIVLNRETSTGNANAAGFFSLGGIAENAGWIGLIIVVVIIACIGFLAFNNRAQEPDSNLSWNGGGNMGFLDKWKKSEKKEEKKAGKWGYKGE
ncbi:MAG: HYR domain-containing protein [Candidatus ainarchaeum sp.]|nr:HYR domain-containing protein [Candidatus ainarchaeum sp.]